MHLHSMASADWQDPDASWLDWLHKAEQRGLDVVAITDHNTIAGVASLRKEIERLQWLESENRLRPQERRALDEYRRLGNEVLVLPGFEFTATFGFHILGIFPPETSVRELELILLTLNVPADTLGDGSTQIGASADVLTAYRVIREAGGLAIAAHANSTHGVAMRDFPFGGQTKIAYTQDPNLHALEVTDLESRSTRATSRFFSGSKPEYPRRMRCIQGSDAHCLRRNQNDKHRLGIGDRVTEIKMQGPPSFAGIKSVLESDDFSLTRPYRRRKEAFDHVAEAREQGNSIVQSFHEKITRQGGRLHAIMSDVVAFANTNGGTVYLGASGRPTEPPIGIDNAEVAVKELRVELQAKVTPPLEVEIDSLETQGQQVVRLQVPEGEAKPYCLDDSKIYLRQEAESVVAVRDEIVQMVKGALLERGEVDESGKPEPVDGRRRRGRRSTSKNGKGDSDQAVAERVPSEVESAPALDVSPPSVGVQIVSVTERGGTNYYTIRDLRNGSTVHNVTLKSARKLWRYAISQLEQNPVDPDKVPWAGDIGVARSEKRAGKQRYDLVQRVPGSDALVVYYGVTEEGCEGPWRQFLVGADTA
ncbi:MAG: putative DNA binding domain-containing protein [Chloroflexota bacterium]|nr:putative DNA binding domain-containing protein [Chloroflexota bacterium]